MAQWYIPLLTPTWQPFSGDNMEHNTGAEDVNEGQTCLSLLTWTCLNSADGHSPTQLAVLNLPPRTLPPTPTYPGCR